MTVGVSLRLLTVMVLWASCFPLITIGLDLAPHLAFAAIRATLAGLCLIALGAFFHRPLPRDTRSWVLVVVVGLGATSLGFLGMFHAAEFVSPGLATRSEEHTSELQYLMRISYAVFCLKKKTNV